MRLPLALTAALLSACATARPPPAPGPAATAGAAGSPPAPAPGEPSPAAPAAPGAAPGAAAPGGEPGTPPPAQGAPAPQGEAVTPGQAPPPGAQAPAAAAPPAQAAGPQAPAAPPPSSPVAGEQTWLDLGHAYLEGQMFRPVVAFDRFFSDEREIEPERERSFLRARSEVRFRDDGGPLMGASLRADLKLPALERRLDHFRLVISGESQDTGTGQLPDSAVTAPPGRLRNTNAELRYGFWDSLRAHADLGAGVLFQLPPGVFGRLRLRFVQPVTPLLLARNAVSGFWRTDTGWGTALDSSLEHPLGPANLLRLRGTGNLTQKSVGVEWTGELAAIHALSPRSAVQLAGALEGRTRAPVAVDRYRVYARYRRDFYRRWLFFELEPEVAWPWDPFRGRHRELAFTVRLEVQFQGALPPPRTPAQPEPAEPRDPGSGPDDTAGPRGGATPATSTPPAGSRPGEPTRPAGEPPPPL